MSWSAHAPPPELSRVVLRLGKLEERPTRV